MSPLELPPVTLLDKYQGPDFQPLYTASVSVSGGEVEHGRASGVVRSDDGNLALDLRLPPELGGPGGGTNPEQLFAASFAACFHGALRLLAARSKIEVTGMVVNVSVAFGRDPMDGLYMLATDVKINIPGIERSLAEELVRNTERICPYAKMARQGLTSYVVLTS